MTIGVSTTGEAYEDEFQYYVQSMQTEEGLPFFQVEEPNLDTLGPLDQLQKKREQQDNFDAGVMRTLRPGKEVPDALPGMIINPRDMDLMKSLGKETYLGDTGVVSDAPAPSIISGEDYDWSQHFPNQEERDEQTRIDLATINPMDPFTAAAERVQAKHPTRFYDFQKKGHLSEANWEFLAKYVMYKLKQAGEKAIDVFQAPYKAYKGELDPMSPEAIGLMADLAGTMVFGPAPIARKVADGTLGSFGGVGAKTLHPQDFVDARKMDLKGHSREEIWEKTGMWKGNDGIWRHEIPGTPELTAGVWPKKGKLPDYYKHDELYKAYPELKDVNVDLTYTKGFGQLDAPANTIRLNPDLIAERQYPLIMTLGHEIQHWIQRKEGFVTGGSNIEHAGSKVLSAIKNKAKAFADAGDKEGMEMIDLLLTDIEKNPRRFYTYMYRRDPGEVEANLAAHRDYAMTPNQKFKESPMATQKRLEEEHNVAGEFRYPEDQPILAEMPEMIKFSRFDEYTRNGVQHYGLEFNKVYKLENIVDNKELYKQHPELRKIKVVRAADENYSFFDEKKNTLHIGTMSSEKLYETLADVVQKKIENKINSAQIGPFDTPLEQRLKGTGVSHPGYVWDVVDKQTGKVVGTYNNSRRATTRVDKLDNEYGAYRYRKVMRKVEE